MYFENCHTAEQCKARYRELAKQLHPDKQGGSNAAFAKMQAEYLHDIFIDSNQPVLYYTIQNLIEYYPALSRYEAQLDYILKENLKLEKFKNDAGQESPKRYKIYKMLKEYEGTEETYRLNEYGSYGRPFVFLAEKFLSKEEMVNHFPAEPEQGSIPF